MSRISRRSRLTTLGACTALGAVAMLPTSPAAAAGWTASQAISATSGSASYPTLLPAPGGAATAAWIQASGVGTGVMISQRAADASWAAPVLLSSPGWTTPAARAYAPSLTPIPGGGVAAIWAERASTDDAIHVRAAVRSAGGTWDTSTIASLNDLTGDGPSPTIVADAQGRLIAAWVDGGFVRASSSSAGTSWDAPVVLTTPHARDEVVDDVRNRSKEPALSVRLTNCGGRVSALWNVAPEFSWSTLNGEAGNAGSEPRAVRVADLGADGWGEPEAAFTSAGVPSDAGLGATACSTAGELALNTVGDVNAHNGRFDPGPAYRASATTRATDGTWTEPTTFAEGPTLTSPGMPTVQNVAYASDGTLLRAAEVKGRTFVSARPAGGAWAEPAALLPAGQTARAPFITSDPSGLQLLAYVREGDVSAHAELRTRSTATEAWSSPTTISSSGLPVGNVQARGAGDGSLTALILQRDGWRWKLSATSYTPEVPRVPLTRSGKTVTLDLDLQRTGTTCPTAAQVWITPSTTTDGTQTTLGATARAITVKVGSGAICTVTGTFSLTKPLPEAAPLKVTVGGPGLRYRSTSI